MKRLLAAVSVAVVALIAVMFGGQMAFGKTLVFCSALEGRLIESDGGPVAGVRVTRKWSDAYSGKAGSDATTTDDQGRFAFGEVTHSSLMAGIIPHSPSIVTTIEAELDGGAQVLLDLDKGNYDPNGEIRDPARRQRGISITCRAGARESGDGWYWGTCTLDD
jgi:hypothetical protein